jgi:hypothetical protein
MLWLELDKTKLGTTTNVILGCIYRVLGQDTKNVNTKLTNILETINRENKIIYHVGDYNLDLIKDTTHPPTNEFININFAHSLNPIINKPTRITNTTATLIDNIFTNHTDQPSDFSGIIPIDISDHLPIFLFKFIQTPDQPSTPTFKRDYSAENIKKFNDLLLQIDWSTVLTCNDAQNAYTYMHDQITKLVKETFPLKQIIACYKNKLPCLTPGLKTSIKTKHKLYSQYLKHPSPELHSKYKKYRNSLNYALRLSE